jgi:hypothetical protein
MRRCFMAAAWGLAMAVAVWGGASARERHKSPQALGFMEFYKCPNSEVARLGDTKTPEACIAACEAHTPAAGCWWLDGTGGFPRECRVCLTMEPQKMTWPNDWGLPMSRPVS